MCTHVLNMQCGPVSSSSGESVVVEALEVQLAERTEAMDGGGRAFGNVGGVDEERLCARAAHVGVGATQAVEQLRGRRVEQPQIGAVGVGLLDVVVKVDAGLEEDEVE